MTKKAATARPKRGEALKVDNKFAEYKQQAAAHGLDLRVSQVSGKRWDHCHVMFNKGKHRIANWWPSNGTVTIGPVKTKADNFADVITLIQGYGGINKTDTENLTSEPNQSNVMPANHDLISTADIESVGQIENSTGKQGTTVMA